MMSNTIKLVILGAILPFNFLILEDIDFISILSSFDAIVHMLSAVGLCDDEMDRLSLVDKESLSELEAIATRVKRIRSRNSIQKKRFLSQSI